MGKKKSEFKNILVKILGLKKVVPGTYLKNLVKIESVTAELFLIWTNVVRTNDAFTNVTVTVGICCRCSEDPMFKV